MRQPTVFQRLIARYDPGAIWVAMFAAGFGWLGGEGGWEAYSPISLWWVYLWIIGWIILGMIFGMMFSLFAGSAILPPIYQLLIRLNGGPMVQGDRVLIISGKYRGRVVTVDGNGQGIDVRVNLGDEERKKSKDYISQTKLLKITIGEVQASAAD